MKFPPEMKINTILTHIFHLSTAYAVSIAQKYCPSRDGESQGKNHPAGAR
jgi:hypothetical protein